MRLGLYEGGDAFRVLQDELQRITSKTRVDSDRNGAGAHRAEEYLQELGPVADDHANAGAGLHADLLQQPCDSVGAPVELRVSDPAFDAAVEVDDRDFLRRPLDRGGEKIAEISS